MTKFFVLLSILRHDNINKLTIMEYGGRRSPTSPVAPPASVSCASCAWVLTGGACPERSEGMFVPPAGLMKPSDKAAADAQFTGIKAVIERIKSGQARFSKRDREEIKSLFLALRALGHRAFAQGSVARPARGLRRVALHRRASRGRFRGGPGSARKPGGGASGRGCRRSGRCRWPTYRRCRPPRRSRAIGRRRSGGRPAGPTWPVGRAVR